MRILKLTGGVISFALAILFWAPLAVIAWARLFPPYQDGERETDFVFSYLTVGGVELFGWQIWAALVTFTLLGIAFAWAGFRAFKLRKSDS
jgi:hypothetical protein